MKNRLDILLFLLLASFWGGSFVAIKFLVELIPPILPAALRILIALLFLLVVYRQSKLRIPFSVATRLWCTGLLAQGIPFALLFWGEQRIAPGVAGIFNGTVPLWTCFFGWVFLKNMEAFSRRRVFGLLLGWFGIAVISVAAAGFRGDHAETFGMLALLGMAMSYGIGTLMNRYLLTGLKTDFGTNLIHQHSASFGFLSLLTLGVEGWPEWTALMRVDVILSILYLGILSTGIAFMIFYHLIRTWGAVSASTVTYVVPIMALFWDAVFFSRMPSVSDILGVCLILSGVFLVQSGKAR